MGSDDSDEVDNRDRVLAPDDLDITKQPEVEEIDDGRYVVSPNGPAKKPDKELLENPDWLDDAEDDQRSTRSQPSKPNSPNPAQSTPTQPPADNQHSQPTQQPQRSSQSEPEAHHPPNQDQPANNPQSTPSNRPPSPASGNQQSAPPNSPGSQSTPPNNQQSTNQPTDQVPNQSTDQPQQQSANTQSTPTQPAQQNRELAAYNQPPAEPPAAEITNENVSKFLAQSLANASGDYGFDATLNVEGTVNRGRMTSDDIGETLETLLRWYAKQTTDEVEPERVLGIILAGSDLAVEYPVQSAYEVVKQHGLGPDDTISDLLSAVREEGSFTVPPSKE